MDPVTITAIVSALGSLLSTWKGTHDASKQNQKTQKLINNNLATAEAERRAKPKNYLDTEEGKLLATQAGENLREAARITNNNAIKTGATTEQRLAQQAKYQQAFNQIMQQLAARSTAYNRENDAILQQARNAHTQGQVAINNMAAQSDVNSGLGVAQAIGNLGSAVIGYYGAGKKSAAANGGVADGSGTDVTGNTNKMATTTTMPGNITTTMPENLQAVANRQPNTISLMQNQKLKNIRDKAGMWDKARMFGMLKKLGGRA